VGSFRAEQPGVPAGRVLQSAARLLQARRQLAVFPLSEVYPGAEWYRQPAACRGRRGEDRYAATECQPTEHQPAAFPLPEVYPQAELYRRQGACRGRRGEDRYAATER
jgi:hypothetical protein